MTTTPAEPIDLTEQAVGTIKSFLDHEPELSRQAGAYDALEHLAVRAKLSAQPALTAKQIIAIRDRHLPNQGETFDCVAFAQDLLAGLPLLAPACPELVEQVEAAQKAAQISANYLGSLWQREMGDVERFGRAVESEAWQRAAMALVRLLRPAPATPGALNYMLRELRQRIEGFVPFEQAEYIGSLFDAVKMAAPPAQPDAAAELARVKALLQDPAAVHVALLRGEIAKPDIRAMLHVYGSEALDKWDAAPPAQAAAPAQRLVGHLIEGQFEWHIDKPNSTVDIELKRGRHALFTSPQPAQPRRLNRARIREIFLANGFTVKEGQTDLKAYLYGAAEELIRVVFDDAAAPKAEQEGNL